MRILQVCHKYYPSIGGVEEHIKNTSERLAKEHEVTVFTCDPSGKLPREEKINGVLVKRFKSFSPGDAYHLSLEMLSELRKSEFDIVHGHCYHALPLFFSKYARAKRFIVTPHYHGRGHTPIRDFLIKRYKAFGKKIFIDAARVIAVSNHEKGLLIKDFDLNVDRVVTIPNGVDLSEFGRLEGIERSPRTILYVGRLEQYKGVQHIIEALPLLDKEFHLNIVGSGPYKGRLVKLIDRLGLNSRVSFHQGLPRGQLIKMYAKSGVFIILSQHESFSIVVAEALAAGTPCLVANTSALSEWIDDKNCFGIEYPISSGRLAELINKVTCVAVGNVNLWEWDEVVKNIIRVYEE